MESLPTEIISKILTRIPIKTLFRLKPTCKSWYSLIKSPEFMKLYINQSNISSTNEYIIAYLPSIRIAELNNNEANDRLSFKELKNNPLKPTKIVQFWGSCNGIVCISNGCKTIVYLFNPLTNSRCKLPLENSIDQRHKIVTFGFGYDSKNDDYKVLKVIKSDSEVYYSLYSRNDDSWRYIVGGDIPDKLKYGYKDGVLINEALHYIVYSDHIFIAKFDLCTESFSVLSFPNIGGDSDEIRKYFNSNLKEFGGCLGVVQRVPEQLDMWVMKEYGRNESWVKLITIFNPMSFGIAGITPILYTKDRRKVLLGFDGLRFGWFDLESQTVEGVIADGLPEMNRFSSGCFVGSHVSIHRKSGRPRGAVMPLKNKKKRDS